MPRNATYRNTGKQQIIREKVLRQRGCQCEECGAICQVELHHIVPVADGGTFDDDNLILLCAVCHLKAHGKTPKKTRRLPIPRTKFYASLPQATHQNR